MTETAYTADDYRRARDECLQAILECEAIPAFRNVAEKWRLRADALAIAARVMEPGFIAQALADQFSDGEQPSHFDLDEATIRAALTGGSHDQ